MLESESSFSESKQDSNSFQDYFTANVFKKYTLVCKAVSEQVLSVLTVLHDSRSTLSDSPSGLVDDSVLSKKSLPQYKHIQRKCTFYLVKIYYIFLKI